MASPYVVPAVAVYDDGSWKSTHVNVVPMLTGLDCTSRVEGEFPLAA